MSAPRVTATPDTPRLRVAVTVPAARMTGGSFLDLLAAAFAEQPEGITKALLGLHKANQQNQTDAAVALREVLAGLVPADVTARLTETEARELSHDALAAARCMFSARGLAQVKAGLHPQPLRSAA